MSLSLSRYTMKDPRNANLWLANRQWSQNLQRSWQTVNEFTSNYTLEPPASVNPLNPRPIAFQVLLRLLPFKKTFKLSFFLFDFLDLKIVFKPGCPKKYKTNKPSKKQYLSIYQWLQYICYVHLIILIAEQQWIASFQGSLIPYRSSNRPSSHGGHIGQRQ